MLLAQGVPHLLAGDEVANSQDGNNNPYCQDNATGWVDWSSLGVDGCDLTAFLAELTALRRRLPQLRPHHFARAGEAGEALWLTPQARAMTEQDWHFHGAHFLSYVLPAPDGAAPLHIVLNAGSAAIAFKLPLIAGTTLWRLVLDTTDDMRRGCEIAAGADTEAPARSVKMFVGEP